MASGNTSNNEWKNILPNATSALNSNITLSDDMTKYKDIKFVCYNSASAAYYEQSYPISFFITTGSSTKTVVRFFAGSTSYYMTFYYVNETTIISNANNGMSLNKVYVR